MATLGLIIVPGMMALSNGHYENFQESFDTSTLMLDKLPLAFYSGMFAYGGWFYVNFVTEEIVNPKRSQVTVNKDKLFFFFRNIPLSITVSLIVVTVCYILTNVSYYAVLTPQEILSSEAVAVLPLIYLMVFIGDIFGLLTFYSFARWFFIGLTTLGLMVHRYRHPELPRPFKVPLVFPLVFTISCFFIVVTSLYSDPVNTGISCAVTLSGLPIYYLVVQKTRIPGCCTSKFNSMTAKLQILMRVAFQEVRTY
uniref:Uncharacterized protein n=1 Tax=Sphaerodactylus townsendi TaxID=933632 RepID=A0ACB8FN53_9SAUR